MLYTALTKKAIRLCLEAHSGQTDRCGLPYALHPLHLAEQMTDEISAAVALLHDVVEDTPYTLDDLRGMGFPTEVVDAVALLTYGEDVPYLDYVARLRDNPVARAVKLADLRHNSDLSRLDEVTEKDLARVEKYRQAIALLLQRPARPAESGPAWRLPCCGAVVPVVRRFCPRCGKPVDAPAEETEARFDPDATVWGCACGGEEEMRFPYCSRCGAKRLSRPPRFDGP